MGADQQTPIDLRLLLEVLGNAAVPVSRDALRDALEADRAQGSKRRLSTDTHIELALRHKQASRRRALAAPTASHRAASRRWLAE